MNSWIKKENKDREKDKEKPRTNWRKNDDGGRNNRNNKSEFTEVRAKPASGVASVVVGGMNVEKFYEEMKKTSFSWLENSLI
jgi:hypothetical protein